MGVTFLQSDLGSAIQHVAKPLYLDPTRHVRTAPARIRAYNSNAGAGWRAAEKPAICTADELHYVPVHNSDWRLALWRYLPSSQGKQRNHPLLLLSGVGTNAIGFDLAPGASFARHMSNQGFDTWILELRGAGLSMDHRLEDVKQPHDAISGSIVSAVDHHTNSECSRRSLPITNANTFAQSGFLEAKQKSAIASQVGDLSQKLVTIIQEGQLSVPSQFIDFQGYFSRVIEDFQKQLDLIVKYNWDFDHYLEEDLPAAMDYIRTLFKPKDDKVLAIGHSMGGILLYAMLSRNSYKGRPSGLASVVTLGSSLDYTTSRSSLKYLLPIADPAQALNVRVIPLPALLAAAYTLASRPPYFLSWLNSQISAQNMMTSEMFEKLILNNFCNISAKLLLQLTTAFQKGGLRDRSGTFYYKNYLPKSTVPVLALAGDQDLICPPEAVYETIKLIPEHLVSFKVLGEPGGPHYGHYDLVGGHLASDEVYLRINEFLSCYDQA